MSNYDTETQVNGRLLCQGYFVSGWANVFEGFSPMFRVQYATLLYERGKIGHYVANDTLWNWSITWSNIYVLFPINFNVKFNLCMEHAVNVTNVQNKRICRALNCITSLIKHHRIFLFYDVRQMCVSYSGYQSAEEAMCQKTDNAKEIRPRTLLEHVLSRTCDMNWKQRDDNVVTGTITHWPYYHLSDWKMV